MAKCINCDKNQVKNDGDLCHKCADEDPNDPNNAQKLVVNELLTYAFLYIHKCTVAGLARVLSDFYSSDEVVEAVQCLVNAHPNSTVIGDDLTRPKRTSYAATLNDAGRLKLAEDLVTRGVEPIVKHGNQQVQFCATNLDRIPKFAPEELNVHSLMLRIERLEMRSKDLTELEVNCQ